MSNQLPISPYTGRPSALRAAVNRSVGIRPPQPQQPQPQAQPRQKSASQADLAEALSAAIVEAVTPLTQAVAQLNSQLGGYSPPAQPVAKSGYSTVRAAASTNTAYATGAFLARSVPFMDGQTAQMLEKQQRAYAQQMQMKAYLADVAAGNDSPKAGIMAGMNQVHQTHGPAAPGWMYVTDVGS